MEEAADRVGRAELVGGREVEAGVGVGVLVARVAAAHGPAQRVGGVGLGERGGLHGPSVVGVVALEVTEGELREPRVGELGVEIEAGGEVFVDAATGGEIDGARRDVGERVVGAAVVGGARGGGRDHGVALGTFLAAPLDHGREDEAVGGVEGGGEGEAVEFVLVVMAAGGVLGVFAAGEEAVEQALVGGERAGGVELDLGAEAIAEADFAAAHGAEASLEGCGGGVARRLGHEVDDAARRAGRAVEEAGGALEEGDGFDAEEVGGVAAADDSAGEAVDAPLVGGHAETAGVEVVVAGDVAVGVEAWDPVEEVGADLEVLLPDAGGIDDRDGAGRGNDRAREFERSGVDRLGAGAGDLEVLKEEDFLVGGRKALGRYREGGGAGKNDQCGGGNVSGLHERNSEMRSGRKNGVGEMRRRRN